MVTAFDTWKCHICGEERPDDKISVVTKPLIINGQVCGEQNIRYCNDRPGCIEGAKEYSFSQEKSGAMEIVTNESELRIPTHSVDAREDISELVDNLFREMQERNAQGLAANQLGYDLSVFVMKLRQNTPICIVNPVITKTRSSYLVDEGCLSLPGVIVCVKRPAEVKVKGVNRYFKPVSYRFKGIEARRACHEIDHLLGKLITDYKLEGEDDGAGEG